MRWEGGDIKIGMGVFVFGTISLMTFGGVGIEWYWCLVVGIECYWCCYPLLLVLLLIAIIAPGFS